MTILFNISGMSAGGAERVISLLANWGVEHNHNVALMYGGGKVQYHLNSKIGIYTLQKENVKNRFLGDFYYMRNMRKVIKIVKPDVIVSFLVNPNIYCCLASMGLSVPLIISERNAPSFEFPNKFKQIIRNLLYKRADGFIFQTEEARNEFPEYIKKASVVIPNPVKSNLPYSDMEHDNKIIVAAGRLVFQKNYPLLIKAYDVFHAKHPEYSLEIYGNGELRSILNAEELYLCKKNRVKFMGLSHNLHNDIKNASMYVLSSDFEGMSNSLAEAMAMGLPCISTDCPCGGSRHLIHNGENGLLIPVGDVKSMAEAMCKLADDRAYAMNLGNKAKEIRNTHSEDLIINRYFGYITSFFNS